MKYSGIDLHSNNSVVTVIDEEDRVVAEKRLPNDLGVVLKFLAPWQAELGGVVVESTYNWYWLVDGLQEAGYRVHLAHPVAVKKYDGLKHAGDETDARHLAHLLRLKILPTGTILPKEDRATRDLGRKRIQLVRCRSAQIVAIENITARYRGMRISSNQIKTMSAQDIDQAAEQLGLDADVTLAVRSQLAVIGTLNAEIERLERRLQERVRVRPEYAVLTTAPGIGRALATTITLETGPLERFPSAGKYASYARCVNSVHTSNGKKKGQGNPKNGNKYLAWAYVEAAHFARRYCVQAQRFYERKQAQTNTMVATKALAHKLARACYHMMKEGKPFDVTRCFA
jgi:transposase